MDSRRIATRVTGQFLVRLVILYLVPVALAGALYFIEAWIGASPAVPDNATHALQFLAVLVAFAVVAAAVAYAGRFVAQPLTTAIEWVQNLRNGDLEPPRTEDGRIQGQDKRGEWYGGWRTFHEFFDALEQLTGELGAAERERAQGRQAREEWVAGISHDLKTPLTSVRGYATLLASGDESPDEVLRQARAILDQTENMERLIEDMEITLRVRADAMPTDPQRVDAVELAHEAAVMVANDPRSGGREVRVSGRDERAWIIADTKLVTRALVNLIVNAVVHNPEGTTIEVSVRNDGDRVGILVADDGVGMDEDTRRHLFDRYFRGGVPGTDPSGTGLGMAVAHSLIVAQGGQIEVESEPGVGTRICLYLPAAPE